MCYGRIVVRRGFTTYTHVDYEQDTSCNASEIELMADRRMMRKHQKSDMALERTRSKNSDQQTRCKRNLFNVPLMTRHIDILDRKGKYSMSPKKRYQDADIGEASFAFLGFLPRNMLTAVLSRDC